MNFRGAAPVAAPARAWRRDRTARATTMRLGFVAECVLNLVGAVLLADWLAESAHAWIVSARASYRLERTLAAAGARGAGPPRREAARPADGSAGPPRIRIGSPVGRFEIGRLGLSSVIVEGVADGLLTAAVGHIPGTALPGEAGNSGLAAHRDGCFRDLGRLRAGDRIEVVMPGGRFSYRVQSARIVAPADIGVLAPTPQATLTLVTCYPFHYIGPAPRRYVVTARLEPQPPGAVGVGGARAPALAAPGSPPG